MTLTIYVDISSGHNIFVSAILEAVRFFSTWAGLRNWIYITKRPEICLAFSDPILGGASKEYKIHQEKNRIDGVFEQLLADNEIAALCFLQRIPRA